MYGGIQTWDPFLNTALPVQNRTIVKRVSSLILSFLSSNCTASTGCTLFSSENKLLIIVSSFCILFKNRKHLKKLLS